MTTNRGVPQGSVLGPFLFVVYMNDFDQSLGVRPVLYADDTTILVGNRNLSCLLTEKETELRNASK